MKGIVTLSRMPDNSNLEMLVNQEIEVDGDDLTAIKRKATATMKATVVDEFKPRDYDPPEENGIVKGGHKDIRWSGWNNLKPYQQKNGVWVGSAVKNASYFSRNYRLIAGSKYPVVIKYSLMLSVYWRVDDPDGDGEIYV